MWVNEGAGGLLAIGGKLHTKYPSIKKGHPKVAFSSVKSFTFNALYMASPSGFEPLLPP